MTAYGIVLAVHIAAALAAYGLPFAYPMVLPRLRRMSPASMATIHDIQSSLAQRLTAPASVVIFLAGAFMATKENQWSDAWVRLSVGGFALISLIGAAVVMPLSSRLADLARSDVHGDDYDRSFRRYIRVERLQGMLVLLVIFVMAAKPFS